ncbi:MAG: NAD(P)/FAD-dependent oxidoreductase [Thermaerobacter sp.]|nr:NAD(P)/FAD-dependent oxidoreductase [Thermaerobacter sp.]
MAVFDVTIIGGGPVGLFGATMARLHGMTAKIIESLPELGGQLYALYPEKPIFDVGGFPSIPAKDLAAQLIAQTERFHPTICLDESVLRIEATESGYRLYTSQGVHETRAILITVGIGAFVPRKLPANDAERFEGRGVYYFVPALTAFAGRQVVVVGGGDTAVDWALAIAQHAASTTLVHRRNEFRAQPESLRLLRETPRIHLKTPYEMIGVAGSDTLTSVTIKPVGDGEPETVRADAVVSGLGFLPTLGPVKDWGLALEGNAITVAPTSMATNLRGVWACGDVAQYPGKVKLIATGFGEIGIAIAQIRTYLDPSKKGHLPHSTNIKSAKAPVENPA